MIELVALMAPMVSAEDGVQGVQHGVHDVKHRVHRVERFFGFRRDTTAADPGTKQPESDGEDEQPEPQRRAPSPRITGPDGGPPAGLWTYRP